MPKAKTVEPLTEDQRRLVAEHVEWAERVAKRHNSPMPVEDRTQEAFVGLIDAARRFDPAWGVKFETYAGPRVVGAILDAGRRPGAAVVQLGRAGRQRGEPEIRVTSVEASNMVSRGGRDAIAADFLFVDDEPRCADAIDRRDAIDRALTAFAANERAVVRSYWLDGRTMKQTGADVGLSESRVSQMMTDVLRRLREHTALADYAGAA